MCGRRRGLRQMPIAESLLPVLRCPDCGAKFEFDERTRPAHGAAEFGILRCGKHTFPVVDGIPIIQREPVGMYEHTRGAAEVEGVAVGKLVRLIERGETFEALLESLAVPSLPAPVRRVLGWRLSHGSFATYLSRWRGKRAVRMGVLSSRHESTAREIFEFFYRPDGPLDCELAHYFVGRFSQPRHLAALALVANVRSEAKPVLDIACGAGHLDHYLTQRRDRVPVIGVDMNYYQLWIARHWIAPAARFVCANAGERLPFASETFAATLCSDAYHYIPRRASLLKEIDRCAPGRMFVLTRVGNVAVMPNEGFEQSIEDYLRELAPAKPRVFDESELLRCYLRRRLPLLQTPASQSELVECKWLSFVCNAGESASQAIPSQTSTDAAGWPHAAGDLALNPMYVSTPMIGGDLRLRFEFPSIHFAYENHGMLAYHPRTITVTRRQLEALSAQTESSELSKLVDSFVLLGMPRRFGRPLCRTNSR
jgi:SAM-dependent methyltransferase/uncharacterized protein YbaR (Trm112 family)